MSSDLAQRRLARAIIRWRSVTPSTNSVAMKCSSPSCADVVDGEDVRMIERRGRARLLLEPLAQLVVLAASTRAENLQRDRTLQLLVVREVDLAHPARAEERADLVTAESGTGLEHREAAIVVGARSRVSAELAGSGETRTAATQPLSLLALAHLLLVHLPLTGNSDSLTARSAT